MLFDKACIAVKAGNGGNGCVGFDSARHMRGGPNGGNGGTGGDVYIKVYSNLLTLADFKYKQKWAAESGKNGSKNSCTGKSGNDLFIPVPRGTEIWINDKMQYELINEGDICKVAEGGIGGFGNEHFKSSEMTTPHFSTNGTQTSLTSVKLIMKYIADVGLIGLPNAGKSTFVQRVSRAPVKVGNYPFSTIQPVLGVNKKSGVVFVDLPGLIENAHQGVGLGYQFLQHIERCRILLHLVDISKPTWLQSINCIINELKEYQMGKLLKKHQVIGITHCEDLEIEKIAQIQCEICKHTTYDVLNVSLNQDTDKALSYFQKSSHLKI